MSHPVKPFVMLVELHYKSEEKANIDIKGVKPVAEHEHKQQETGSYTALRSIEGDPKILTSFEAYDSLEYLVEKHTTSEPYLIFKEEAERFDLREKVLPNFFVPKGGFLQRNEPSSIALDKQFVWIARFKAHPGRRDELMQIILTHTANVQRTEEETLSFLVLESTENDDSVVLFERYTSQEYFKNTHVTSESMQEYRSKSAPLVAEKVSEGYHPVSGFVDKREKLVQ